MNWPILFRKRSASIILSFLIVCSSQVPAHAQRLQALQIQRVSAEVTILFEATPGLTLSNFTLEFSSALGGPATPWSEIATTDFTELSPGNYQVTLARDSQADKGFYRILADGVVLVPEISTRAVVEGGDGGVIIAFPQPFSGAFSYSLRFSDGTIVADSPLLQNQSSFIIPLQRTDDVTLTGDDFVTLTLFPDQVGTVTRNLNLLEDEVIYDGIFAPEEGGTELPFCLVETNFEGSRTLVLANRNGASFFPEGDGPITDAAGLTDTAINVSLSSAILSGESSPVGIPLQYDLQLESETASNGMTYQGKGTLTRVPDVLVTEDDAFEPNDDPTQGFSVPALPFQSNNLNITDDEDYFIFTPVPGEEVSVQIQFSHARGDLDFEILDEFGDILASALSGTDHELETITRTNSDPLILRVFGFSGSRNNYSLYIGSAPPLPRSRAALASVREGNFFLVRRPTTAIDPPTPLEDQ